MRFLLSFLLLCVFSLSNGASLPALNIQLNETSVSGLSAGGFFAVQMHIAYSSIMKGAGIFAGGPYHCSKGNEARALSSCMTGLPLPPNSDDLALFTASRSQQYIDDIGNLVNQNVFLFSGTLDTTVSPIVMTSLFNYYKNFIKTGNIVFANDFGAAHTLPTDNPLAPNACVVSVIPYISNCLYDGAGAALQTIYGRLNPRRSGALNGTLIKFDQAPFFGGNAHKYSMASTGYAYIPASCAAGARCRIHVAFHGCQQYAELIGTKFVTLSGYNEWADTNNLVILYPQTKSSVLSPINPNGCFDWWGYNSGEQSTYDTKRGSQMKGVKAMIDQLASGSL